VTLKVACNRVVDPKLTLRAELRLDGEPYALEVDGGRVDVVARPAFAPMVVLETDYDSMVAATDGAMTLEDFARHVTITSGDPTAVQQTLALLAAAVQRIVNDGPQVKEAQARPGKRRPEQRTRARKARRRG